MSPSIFLTLLCLGVASAAPAAPAAPVADLTAEAQAEQWAAAVIWDTVKDVINSVGEGESPTALEDDNQEPTGEQEAFRAACGDMNLKTPKEIFNKIKGISLKASFGKVFRGLAKHILREIVRSDNLVDIATIIGNHILEESNKQPVAPENNGVSDMAGDAWIPEPVP